MTLARRGRGPARYACPVTADAYSSAPRPRSARTAPARRAARRAATACALALVPLSLALAGPAGAVERSDGDSPGEPISTLQALGLFVGIPLGIYLVIALLTFAPASTRGPRYRPGSGWTADSAYLGSGAVERVEGTGAGHSTGSGGASGTW